MSELLEQHERAQEAAEQGRKHAALVIAVLAAGLAIAEQQGKHAEVTVQESSIAAADTWNEYQAKSVRAATVADLARLLSTLDPPADAALAARRADALRQFEADRTHYEGDPASGKDALARKAHALEARRDTALERAHVFDNAAAAMQLGIVLATASVITASRWLIRLAYLLGGIGIALGALSLVGLPLVG